MNEVFYTSSLQASVQLYSFFFSGYLRQGDLTKYPCFFLRNLLLLGKGRKGLATFYHLFGHIFLDTSF